MPPFPHISAAILAGGGSRRMGRNKALLPFRGRPLVAHVHETLQALFDEVFVVAGDPAAFAFLPCPTIPDRVPGRGPISGVDAALRHSRNPYVLVVGCDAPLLSPRLLERIAAGAAGADLTIPCGPAGPEPLCAVYGKGCLPRIEEALREGDYRLAALIGRVHTREISRDAVASLDPGFQSFRNINTPEDYRRLSDGG